MERIYWNDFYIDYYQSPMFTYRVVVTRQGDNKPLFKKTLKDCNFSLMMEKVKAICENKYKSYMI